MTFIKKHLKELFIISALGLGLFLRSYQIDYGLPYSFINDELDIYYEVIRFALNYKFFIPKEGLKGFAPSSYVYGMFPTYFLTLSVMTLNKISSLFKLPVDFNFYFVFMRIVTAVFSLFGVLFTTLIYKKVFKDKVGIIITLFLSALNWKLIQHSHYLNHDTYLMVFSTGSIYFLISYFETKKESKKLFGLLISAILFGLAVGTKITALLAAPIIAIILLAKKDFKGLFFYAAVTFLSFTISNPFSILYFNKFISRVLLMKNLEAGVVFGAVDTNPLKYIFSLTQMLTPIIFIFSVIGILKHSNQVIKHFSKKDFLYPHLIMLSTILIYILFFSLSPRITERWLLPIIPLLLVYSAKEIRDLELNVKIKREIKILIATIIFLSYAYYPCVITKQLQMGKPRVNAYLWTKNFVEIPENSNLKILMYTNKGDNDPFANIPHCDLKSFNVYESRGAQNQLPVDPINYDIVVLYSFLKRNIESDYIKSKYPDYYQAWSEFINNVTNSNRFKLIKSFSTTSPNLMEIPEFSIYKRID
jgi:hypothetical protein